MNPVADESVDQQIVDRLRAAGHAVVYIAEMAPGIPDVEVLRLANSGNALVTVQGCAVALPSPGYPNQTVWGSTDGRGVTT